MPQQPLPNLPPVDPAPLYDLLHAAAVGNKRFQALRAALNLNLFERLEKECEDSALASSLNLDPVLTSSLCALLAEMGLVERNANALRRTDLAACFLDSQSPFFQGEVLRCMEDDLTLWAGLEDLLRGGPMDISKDALIDLEWLLTRFPGIDKERNVYCFENDLSREEHLAFITKHYQLLSITEAREFAPPALGKFGDRLDSQLIIARKRKEAHHER